MYEFKLRNGHTVMMSEKELRIECVNRILHQLDIIKFDSSITLKRYKLQIICWEDELYASTLMIHKKLIPKYVRSVSDKMKEVYHLLYVTRCEKIGKVTNARPENIFSCLFTYHVIEKRSICWNWSKLLEIRNTGVHCAAI